MGKNRSTIEVKKLSMAAKLGYGCGDVACNVVYGMVSSLITLFYTDYAGISAAAIGTVMLLSRVFDGVSDVIMAIIVNKTKSKWGIARPWIIWMALPYAISAVSLFTIPVTSETMQLIYIFVTYNLVSTVFYTAINVPYGTLSTLMTRESEERSLLSIFRMTMSPAGRIMVVSCTMPLVRFFGNDVAAWAKAMAIWAVIAIILLYLCFRNCEETVVLENVRKEKVPFFKSMKALLTNCYFWICLFIWTLSNVHLTIVGIDLPYYCKYIFGNDTWMYSVAYMTETIMLIVGGIGTSFLLKKYSKRDVALAGALLAIGAQVVFLLNPYNYAWLLGTSIVRALGEAPMNAIVFGMLGDAVEYGQYKKHIRQESLVFGAGSMGAKLGIGLSSAATTGLLAMSGYVSSTTGGAVQTESAMDMIVNLYKWGPILVYGVSALLLFFYKLDKYYPKIMEELHRRELNNEI